VLKLQLELRNARWYPEDEKAGYRDVYAFAEQGRPSQSSGPLIRVSQGTQIHATVRNMLPSPAKVYGLHHHPGDPNDAVNLAANETRELQFVAGEPGGLVIPSRKKRGTARKLRGRASGKRQEEAQWKTSPSSLQHRK